MILLPIAWSLFLFPHIEGRWLIAKEVTWSELGSHDFTLDQGNRAVHTDGWMDFLEMDMQHKLGDEERLEDTAEFVSVLATRGQTPAGVAFKCGIMRILRALFTCPPKLSVPVSNGIHKAASTALQGGYAPETYPKIVTSFRRR